MSRVLIINIARLGDLLQCSPLIAGLKRQDPACEISLLVSAHFSEIARDIPGVDRVLELSLTDMFKPLIIPDGSLREVYDKIKELSDGLRGYHFDRIINITHTHYSAVITWLARAGQVDGMTLDNEGYKIIDGQWANYYINSCLNRDFNRFNLVDIHTEVGRVKTDGRLHYSLTNAIRDEGDRLLGAFANPGEKLIGVVPGASTPEKAWNVDLLGEALRRISERILSKFVILGAPSEKKLGDRLQETVPGTLNLCGKTNIRQLAGVINNCDLLVSNDTGPMHLAAALGIRVLDISLGSALSHETAPYGSGHVVIEPDIACYPCNPKVRCPHLNCHSVIKPGIVAEVVFRMLQGSIESGFEDERIFSGLRLFVSGFDSDGMYELKPLVRRPLSRDDLFNAAMRAMWKLALDDRKPWKDEYTAEARLIAKRMEDNYIINENTCSNLSDPESLTGLRDLAITGKKLANELSFTAEDNSKLEKIKRLGDEIAKVDLALIRIAYGNNELRPLVAQFTYGKDNLKGRDLKTLSGETAGLYQDVIDWANSVKKWYASIRNSLMSDLKEAAA